MFLSPSEHYQESDCPFGDGLMVMGEGFSQVSNDDNGNGGDDGEDRKDKNTFKKLCNGHHPPNNPSPLWTQFAVSVSCLIAIGGAPYY